MKLPDFISPKVLGVKGVLGMNGRNASYIQRYNERRYYPLVDDKLLTKKLCIAAGLSVPELYTVVEYQAQIKSFHKRLESRQDFVIKPARGSGGNGITVVAGRDGENYIKTNGKHLTREQVDRILSNVLSGLHSLDGRPDCVLTEYRIQPHPVFENLSYQGVPDIRLLVFQGYPVMAMVRLSTSQSDGKANLHQGAVGVGLDLASGTALRAVCRNRIITEHPDTKAHFEGFQVPEWETVLKIGARSYELTKLGYLGVDLVIDKNLGPMVLELNARPGLSIQLANGKGLLPRLQKVEQRIIDKPAERAEDRIAFSKGEFGGVTVPMHLEAAVTGEPVVGIEHL